VLLEYENIVIGSCTRALMFAFLNEYPVIYTSCEKPHEYEFLDLTLDTSPFKIENTPTVYRSFSQDFEFGVSEVLLWEKLKFLLSINGLIPLSDFCNNIRYDGEKLRCSSEYSKLCEIKFEKCFYFGDYNLHNLIKERKKENARYKVYDKIAFHSGGKHIYDYLETDEHFVEQAWFYSSDRVHGNTGVKDVCVFSVLTEAELRDPSYTQTMSNFKLLSIMEKHGLRGKIIGYKKNGLPKYRNFKTSHIERRKFLIDYPQWTETHNVRRVDMSLENLMLKINSKDMSEYKYLNEYQI
tara:strand:+ start:847 stop:1734 length:888 start_codon:yes stop_codon:yes gene_type:complete